MSMWIQAKTMPKRPVACLMNQRNRADIVCYGFREMSIPGLAECVISIVDLT